MESFQRRLGTGQELSLPMSAGAELYCVAGSLQLTAARPWLGEPTMSWTLCAGQGWRAGEGTLVKVLGVQAGRYELIPAAQEKKKPRAAGLFLEGLLRSLMRGQPAA